MSAAALHVPAHAGSVAWHYVRLLGRRRAGFVISLTFFLGMMSSVNAEGFEGFILFTPLLALLPMVQWGASAGRGEIDHAMPLGRVRHELLWVGAGAACAVALMIPPLALLTFLRLGWSRQTGEPVAGIGWFPPVLLASGLTAYLLGAAAWLRGARAGLLLCVLYAVQVVPMALLGPRWPRVERLLALREPLAPGEGPAWLATAVLTVAAAGAVVWMVAGAHNWLPRWKAGDASPRRPAPSLAVGEPRDAGVPRRPARLLGVLWSELRLLRGPTLAGVAIAVACTLWVVPVLQPAEAARGVDNWSASLVYLALWWPTVVWLRGRGPWRRRLEPVPASALSMRLARVAAGAMSLQVAVLAAAVAHAVAAAGGPRFAGAAASYAGAAGCALFLYLLASFLQVVARDHALGWAVAWVTVLVSTVIPVLMLAVSRETPVGGGPLAVPIPQPGSWLVGVLLLAAVTAALLAGATRIGVSADRGEPLPVR